jgi:peptide/histidine transporter 3/4
VIYLTRVMGEDAGFAAVQVSLFEGTCYLTPLLGAWLADSLWGRYRTILVFSLVYFVGMVMLALSAWIPGLTPPPDLYPSFFQNLALFGSLYVVALGTGGIKPNVSAFGADQFDVSHPSDRREKNSFFNWFYFSINLGSLLAVTVIVWIQENVSWAIGFAIPAFCMALAVVVFVAGSGRYRHVAPSESPFSRVFSVIRSAIAMKSESGNSMQSTVEFQQGSYMVSGSGMIYRFNGEESADEGVADEGGYEASPYEHPNHGRSTEISSRQSFAWLDVASQVPPHLATKVKRFSKEQVDEVKLVLRMLPIFLSTIMYWTVYMQMGSFFVMQGAHMNRNVNLPLGLGNFLVPAASLSMINTLAIVTLIPMYDKLLVPFLRSAGRPMTLLRRIGWGLVIAILAMSTAAIVEKSRLAAYRDGRILSSLDDNDLNQNIMGDSNRAMKVVDMSVWWQIPQYLLIGLSEVFTAIGQLEFFYDQAPDVMRSCSMALQLLSVCIGSYLSGAVVWAVQFITSSLTDPTAAGGGWLPKDLNLGRLDLFFLLLAGLMTLNLAFFLWVAMAYEYKTVEHAVRVYRPSVTKPVLTTEPSLRLPSAPVPSARRSAAHPTALPGFPTVSETPESPSAYGRSVTFLPQTPALPAPFR